MMFEKFQSATNTFTFESFFAYCETLVAEGRTSGPDQSDFLVQFTKLNLQRMKRWHKTVELAETTHTALAQTCPQQWFVITEAWCGDSAQNLPVLARMAEASSGKIDLKIVLRDEHPELINAYLTNGGRSIPKLVSFDPHNKVELFNWGPRPAGASALFLNWKTAPNGRDFEAFEKELHTWYAHDKGEQVQAEVSALLLQSSGVI